MQNGDAKAAKYQAEATMDAAQPTDLHAEAARRGVVFARFYALDETRDFEVFERAKNRVDQYGDITQVIARCAGYGEQAELLDVAGFVLGTVYCDGSLDWWV